MTQEDIKLLLIDLSAKLPYGVICQVDDGAAGLNDGKLIEIDISKELARFDADYYWDAYIDDVKPYLRPMSSMNEDEFSEYFNIKYNKVTYKDKWKRIDVGKFHNVGIIPIEDYLDWLNSHHFDYHGLIEKGLALEAPEGMYDLKEK